LQLCELIFFTTSPICAVLRSAAQVGLLLRADLHFTQEPVLISPLLH